MIKSLLPNCRFLTLNSQDLGRDWPVRSREIDSQLEALGMDLAEEAVYILFDSAPGTILAQEGAARIARPVIGPKKLLQAPFALEDWVQAPVYQKTLLSSDWDQILEESFQEWQGLQRQALKIAAPFMIIARRRLGPELTLSVELLFHE